jgi:hypothetical protein
MPIPRFVRFRSSLCAILLVQHVTHLLPPPPPTHTLTHTRARARSIYYGRLLAVAMVTGNESYFKMKEFDKLHIDIHYST